MGLKILSYTCGLGLIAYLKHLIPIEICLTVLLLLVIIGFWGWSNISPSIWPRRLFFIFCCFWLGFSWGDYQAFRWINNRLTPEWAQKEVLITGTIISLPIEENKYTRFLFLTEQFAGQTQHKRIQLNWQNPHPPLTVGEKWRMTVRLKPPHALTNFGAFNRMRFLWGENIHASGSVIVKKPADRLAPSSAFYFMARLRQHLAQTIKQTVTDPTLAAIISALTIGLENGFTDQDWQILQRTGTVHLVVIAGLHIGFLVWIVGFVANKVWRLFPRLLLWVPAQQAATVAALFFALAYGSLAGFGIPAQRAVIMIVLISFTELFYRQMNEWRRLLWAFTLVITFDPGALFSAGFWLSFAAVAWITYSLKGDWRQASHWRQWLRIQFALFLGLMPLTIYFFHQFSLVSIIANLPAIIWVGWLIVPLCLTAAVANMFNLLVSHQLFKLSAYLLMPLWHFLQWLSAWPFAGWQHAVASSWILLLALSGAGLYLSEKKIAWRWLGLLGFIPIGFMKPAAPPPGDYWLTLLDVGQGLAITIQTTHHLMVYDAGMSIPEGFDAGRDIVSPYLVTLGSPKIDVLMISHGDNDHSGGAKTLLKGWSVKRLMTSIPRLFYGFNPEYCQEGEHWQWDGVPFQILSPPVNAEYQDNNSSCVLQIGEPGRRLLLTGDIQAETEQRLVAEYGSNLRSEILVAPHHGSKTSSTVDFLQKVKPEYALFSLGFYNRFHFPAPSVARRYQEQGIRQWLTSVSGAIKLKVNAQGVIEIQPANPHQYFWQ